MPPADLAPITDADVPPELAWPFTERDGTRGRLIVAMRARVRSVAHRGSRALRGDVPRLDLGADVVVGGNAFVQHDIVRSVNRDGPRASLVAAVGAALVVVLILGATRQAAVTLLCGASGVFLLLTAASLLGIRINFLDFVALPITIGIGIDYSVNIAARHRSEGRGSAARILAAAGPGGGALLVHDRRRLRVAAVLGEPGDPVVRPRRADRRGDLHRRRHRARARAARLRAPPAADLFWRFPRYSRRR